MVQLRVRQVAEQKGLDIAKLSRRSDISYKTAFALWHDPHQNITIDTLAKIAAALNVKVVELINEEN